jgi:trimethylamine--corrinoid protein Co-methyltransferase
MERVGQRFHHPKSVELFRKAGADVSDGNLVRIPHHLVEWALSTAPKQILIFDQNGNRAMTLGGHNVYFGVGSDCPYIWDPYTGERRKAKYEDQINAIRVVDHCDNIDFLMSVYLPSDIDDEIYDRFQMQTMLLESDKPIVFVNNEFNGLLDCWEMAQVVAGGLKELQRKPFAISYACGATPTQHNSEALEKLYYCAEHGLPLIYAVGGRGGMTAPITTAGALALGNAGNLGAVVLSQLVREGCPIIRSSGSGGTMDMKTLNSPFAVPDKGPFGWDLAHFYGLPIFGTAGRSDSKCFDTQAAAEAALSILLNAISGANLVHDVGYLDFALNTSLELVVYCDELIGWVKRYLRGLEINEETLALDLIEEVGTDGQFLDSRHTLSHFREIWYPFLADRQNFEKWVADGSRRLEDRVNEKVREIIETHRCEPVASDTAVEIRAIAGRAEDAIRERGRVATTE